ncbi:MAG: DUF1449 family protein [Deltaproteobacteria bacterium]|nr:DUF1449 family protein [Deltaproteobacteria bacterium]
MSELLHAALQYPTAILSVLLGIALLYWLFVILGALDIDLIGEADLDGIGDGVDIGDAGGHDFGDAGGHDAGDAGGHDAGGHDGSDGPAAKSGGAGFLSAFGLRKVPLTISLSAIILVAWVACLLSMHYLRPTMSSSLPAWLLGLILLFGALLLAMPLAGVLVRPLAPVFKTQQAKTRRDYIGSTCTIDTTRVDADFGQARLVHGNDHLNIAVRCDDDENRLAKGSEARIVAFDAKRDAFVVEPLH